MIVLLAGLELPTGLSVCVAEDGHATIEVAHAELPCTSHLRRHHPDGAVEASHLGEHPCRDLPFLGESARRDASGSRLVVADVAAISTVALLLPAAWQTVARLPSAPPRCGPSEPRRDVVLLI